jgi:hypothetical protein
MWQPASVSDTPKLLQCSYIPAWQAVPGWHWLMHTVAQNSKAYNMQIMDVI